MSKNAKIRFQNWRFRCTATLTIVLSAVLITGCSNIISSPAASPITSLSQSSSRSSSPQPTSESAPVVIPISVPATSASTVGVSAQVIRVVDGDTIEVSLNGQSYKVRYIGMDTPETVDPNRPVMPFGPEASAKNKEIVEGRVVRLEKDVSETDRYGRLLRYVYVGDLFVNAELVRLGYAQVATYPPDVKYQNLFLQLQRDAQAANRGLWGLGPTTTSQPLPSMPSVGSPSLNLQIISVTSPVSPGASATLIAQTIPGADCSITVYYKSGASSASGLTPKTADNTGKVSWTWKVGTSTTPGSWRITVKAVSAGLSATQETYFDVR